jgi:hypothetical protein
MKGPFLATHHDPVEAIEGVKGSGFVGQAAERESGERDFRFLGMYEALAVDFLGHDSGFEEDDAHAVPVCVEGAL